MKINAFAKTFVANKSDKEKLRKLFNTSDSGDVIELILQKATEALGFTVWTSTLSLVTDEEKLFEIIKDVR